MIFGGIKASHDGAVAVIDGNRLVFSIEVEKVDNNPRYSKLGDLEKVEELLRSQGLSPTDIDRYVVDGWFPEIDGAGPSVAIRAGGEPYHLPVGSYTETADARDPLSRQHFDAHHFSSHRQGYASYSHTSGHVLGSYCTSPFATAGENALVVVWDGAVTPRAYQVDCRERQVNALGPLLPLTGNTFADFCSHFEPFYDASYKDPTGTNDESSLMHHLSIAGKAMAYAALGKVQPEAFGYFDRLIGSLTDVSRSNAFTMGRQVADAREQDLPGLSDADVIATFQAYLGHLLVTQLSRFVKRRFPDEQPNLALGGGCALNIKWNSMLRDSALFKAIWVPPFPNDSGAAIGTACCEMFRSGAGVALEWDVYRGPALRDTAIPSGWTVQACDERRLAHVLHAEGEPVTVLSGRAELGPRALGNRSILAPAVGPSMKDRLNEIKQRASYRPVAPICLVDRASEVFDPGGADPYMLFEHTVRPDWCARVPAIVHLDGSARLQTIEPDAGVPAARILAEYARLSGIPVLCNTSANLAGSGFFPDIATAAVWGATRHVWSDGRLYTRPEN